MNRALSAGLAVLAAGLLLSSPAAAQPGTNPTPQDDSGDTQEDATAASANPPSLHLLGYADSNFRAEWPQQGDAANSFGLGELDLLFTSSLASDWNALAEVVIEAEGDNEFLVDLERAVVTYSPRDTFNFSAGRFHSVLSYYNSTFPHAAWHQVAANRPFTQDFEDEGGLLPSHGVGISLSGRTGGPLRVRYIVEVTNGTGVIDSAGKISGVEVQSSVDQNNRKSIVGALQFRPARLPGLQFGLAISADSLGTDTTRRIRERIVSGHLVFQDDRWEWLTEAYGLRHTQEAKAAASSTAVYTQLAGQFGVARPFLRFERLQVSADDPLHGTAAGVTQGPSVGVRFDPSTFVGIKTQVDWLTHSNPGGTKRFVAQVAFAF